MTEAVFHRNGKEGGARMKTALICHERALLDREGLARWLASFSDLVGIIVLQETKQRMKRRIRREINRTGFLRFIDVIAFRFYHRFFLARKDQAYLNGKLNQLLSIYPQIKDVPVLFTHTPNSAEAEKFIRGIGPDILLARCKTLLKESVFSIPSIGTFVMHPGICPEYRNAHGCFWALANGELDKVGMTLLRIDKGVDTGPVYGYYSYDYDEIEESHIVIQHRVVLENLNKLEKRFAEIYAGQAASIDTSGRKSSTWGQPWLSSYLKWKQSARRRRA